MQIAKIPACAVLFFSLSACNGDKLEQIGYFKSENKNRVFVLQAIEEVTEDEVAERTAKLMHTDGQMTIAFIAEHSVAGLSDYVTQAPDFQSANDEMLKRPKLWRWWYRKAPSGEEDLVDCKTGGSSICEDY